MNEQTIHVARLHWLIFFGPLFMALCSLFLGIYVEQLLEVSLGLLAIAFIWGLTTWLNYHFSSLSIEKRRVIFRTGIIVRNTTDIPATKIETIDVRQSILGSIMGYGLLTITGTGGTQHWINFVEKPLTCRRYIEQIMQETQN